MNYLKRSNYLFRTSDRYNRLLNAINKNINLQIEFETSENCIEASKVGNIIWNDLKELIKLIGAKSLLDIEYETTYDLLYWASNNADALEKAARKDNLHFDKYFEFCKEYVDMHSEYLDRDVRNLGNIRRALASCYYYKGHFNICDALFENWLKQDPYWSWGWIGWSDCYWLFNFGQKKDLHKAENILKRGMLIKKIDNLDVMQDRFNDLQREKIKQSLQVV